MAIPISVPCPICSEKVAFDSPNMPFCSDRCRDRDLGNWATEKYVIGSGKSNELESELEGGYPEQRRSADHNGHSEGHD